jgi:hypothetical protein
MDLSFFRFGRFLRIPMLDPENEAYVSRVALIVSFVGEALRKWEFLQDEAVGSAPPLVESLAYAIRKLAEMLSVEDIFRLKEQVFFLYAFNLVQNPEGEAADRGRCERAIQVLVDGFSEVQANLDLGFLPYGAQGLDWVEPTLEFVEEAGLSSGRENIFQRSLEFVLDKASPDFWEGALQEASPARSFMIA